MPLYEYRCRACENVFEYMQSLSEGAKRKCEECGGRLEKLVSRAGFILKGSGWYETDFRAGGSRTAPKSEADGGSGESSSKTSPDKSDSSKSDSSKSDSSKSDSSKSASKAVSKKKT